MTIHTFSDIERADKRDVADALDLAETALRRLKSVHRLVSGEANAHGECFWSDLAEQITVAIADSSLEAFIAACEERVNGETDADKRRQHSPEVL